MSKSGEFLAFLAGAAVGAAAVYLSCTEKGRQAVKSGKNAVENCADDVLEKIEEVKKALKAEASDK